MKIRGVWAHNFHQELSQFDHCLHRFPVISFDTEFPGFLRDTPRDALEDQRYEDVKFNVESLKLLQLGFTLSDAHGNIGGTWEFHLSGFNEKSDPHVVASISLLKRNGLDFARLGQFGISVTEFVFGFLRVLRIHRGLHDLTWVCFHGLYDLAYLLKLLTQKPLPDSVVMFAKALGVVFGTIYDVKFMARYCRGFFGGEIGLARVAKLLDVERSGEAHQAGSDSLLTAAVFSKMNATFRSVAGMSQGCLYGISPTIVRYWQPTPVILRRPCFPVAAPHVYGARLIHRKVPNYLILSDLYHHLQGELEGCEVSAGPFKELSKFLMESNVFQIYQHKDDADLFITGKDAYLFDLKPVESHEGCKLNGVAYKFKAFCTKSIKKCLDCVHGFWQLLLMLLLSAVEFSCHNSHLVGARDMISVETWLKYLMSSYVCINTRNPNSTEKIEKPQQIWGLGLAVITDMVQSLRDSSACSDVVENVIPHFFSEKAYMISYYLSAPVFPSDGHDKKRPQAQQRNFSY
ncbi:hypothetical protein GBA52_003794 [Prunus armeniaca]|nr:hypothetical protein GBA52_003794 [Prunus armeniaca]